MRTSPRMKHDGRGLLSFTEVEFLENSLEFLGILRNSKEFPRNSASVKLSTADRPAGMDGSHTRVLRDIKVAQPTVHTCCHAATYE